MTEEAPNKLVMDEQKLADSRELVRLLLANDPATWDSVHKRVVVPLFWKHAGDMQILGYTKEDLRSRLMEMMIHEEKLSSYGYRCPLFNWLWVCLARDILRKLKRDGRVVIVDPESETYKGIDPKPPVWQGIEVDEAVALAGSDFAKLWRKNPLQSYVLLLRAKMKMSSEQIRDLLNISSVASVDKMTERARKEMIEMAAVWRGK